VTKKLGISLRLLRTAVHFPIDKNLFFSIGFAETTSFRMAERYGEDISNQAKCNRFNWQ
jgi:hypothetical protein